MEKISDYIRWHCTKEIDIWMEISKLAEQLNSFKNNLTEQI